MPSILVVDDEPTILVALQFVLQREGYAVCTAPDGPEALRALQAERPHVVLLDITMPKMHGLDVLRRIRTTAPEVRVIMMSGDLDGATREAALALGALACLEKPIRVEALKQHLAQALALIAA